MLDTPSARTVIAIGLSLAFRSRAQEEIIRSKQILEDLLDHRIVDFSYPFGMRRHFTPELRRYCFGIGFRSVANAIPGMQYAGHTVDNIQRTPWDLDAVVKYNLDSLRIDGRLFELLTGRSAVI